MNRNDDLRHMRKILEAAAKDKLSQDKLRYGRDALDPVLSRDTLDVHFGKLAKKYVERYNDGEGDADFNYGGAVLHNIYFAQFREPKGGNKPTGAFADLIDSKYGSYGQFQDDFVKAAMAVQGSGWLYVDRKGDIQVIKNHSYRDGMKIVLLVDWWEHAWFLDYQSDKQKYLQNLWRIIDWDVINQRLV
jgi:Fe-Mn family superoxide dismutase